MDDKMARYVNPEAFLDDQLTLKYRAMIPATIEQAYKAAEDLAQDQPILQVESAVANRGRLRAWATDLAIERLIKTGRWPFDYDWASFEKPTGKYLRIKLESSLMSVSLVPDHRIPPRQVKFRTNNALGNPTGDLFEQFELTPKKDEIRGLPYFVLVHGHQKPEFAHIGMPCPEKQVWTYKTPNLFHMPHLVIDELPPTEAEDQEAILTLKEELRKWQRDNNDE